MKFLFIILSVFLLPTTAITAEEPSVITELDLPEEKILQLGEQIYREGILPSGEPVEAVVMGDIPVDGRMFTCDDCHQRSGLGSEEGTIITWPTNGKELQKPRRKTGAWRPPEGKVNFRYNKENLPSYYQIENARPAYTDESLAMVLWTGVDPAGRKLNPIMPLYNLEDRDMAILVHYLNNLSVEQAPGVDEKTLYFATVVSDDIPQEDRRIMLQTLQVHIDARNSQSRHEEHRASAGPFYKTEMFQAYRRWQLDVWELKGPKSTWTAQLQEYYRKRPVFALLGGMTSGSWQTIHEFSEQNKIPAIFPLTDIPAISETDWYTLYFSKGVYQEGEAAARYLHTSEKNEPQKKIVIISRDNLKSKSLVSGFAETWQKFNEPDPSYLEIPADRRTDRKFWQELLTSSQPTILILWLDPEDLQDLASLGQDETIPQMIFLSADLLESSFDIVPEILRNRVYMTHRYSLPQENKRRKLVVQRWLQTRGIPVVDLTMQSKMYFLGWMLTGAVKQMRSEFFREYFLEGFDMMTDQDYAIAVFPRLSFGPGQRYASKGCYIVQLSEGTDPELVKVSDWVIH